MASTLKRRIKQVVEGVSGRLVERHDSAVTFASRKRPGDAWFSRSCQITALVESLHIDCVLDVGANRGQFAQGLRSFYDGDIVSFEPVSAAFEDLTRAAASDDRWQVHHMALGDEDTELTINVPDFTEFSSLLDANSTCSELFGDRTAPTRTEVVPVRRLDGLVDEIYRDFDRRRVLLKMDTQGFDQRVFAGVGDRLGAVQAVVSEVSVVPIYEGMLHWTESICAFEQAGFAVVGMFPVTRDDLRVIEYDCLLARAAPGTEAGAERAAV